MFIKHPTFSKANLFFLLSALTLCTASAVCQQDGDQPQFKRHILSSESLEISHFLKQAQDGDRIAQFNVASRYLQIVRVPQDYKNPAMWYERAAEQGLAAAEFMMGFLYEHGKGVRRDYTRAADYAAAGQGHGRLCRSEDRLQAFRFA